MTEAEAYSLILNNLEFAHLLGEGVWGRLDIWIGVSTALIVMAYFAPERLKWGVAALVLTLYVLLTLFITINTQEDANRAAALVHDAIVLAEKHKLQMEVISNRRSENTGIRDLVIGLFIGGMFFGTIGFLLYTCRQNYLVKHKGKDDDGSTIT